MLAAKEQTGAVFPLAAFSHSLPKTRVRGSTSENQAFIGASGQLTLTLHWGCGYIYGGKASGSLDQRFYASTYGRFTTVDPSKRGISTGAPQSWNRYAYVEGDPVNGNDPTGMFNLPRDYCEEYPNDPDCYCFPGGPNPNVSGFGLMGCGGPAPDPEPAPAPPKCPDNIRNFFDTLTPIASSLADQWSSSTNAILALSAYESGWLGQHAQDLHNPFGLTKAGGNDLQFSSYDAAGDFWSKNDGKYIQGITEINQFADAIQPHYNSVNPSWKKTLKDVYQSVLKWRSICQK
jgi:RHS repeat-associated protein